MVANPGDLVERLGTLAADLERADDVSWLIVDQAATLIQDQDEKLARVRSLALTGSGLNTAIFSGDILAALTESPDHGG